MSNDNCWCEQASKALAILEKGAFLTAGRSGDSNTMTIAWGSVGVLWHRPVFTAWVRPSRHTFGYMERGDEFTVSLPMGDMQQALTLCGTKSGRDMDKIAAAGLTLKPGKKVTAPVVAGCGLYYECKLLYKQALVPSDLPGGVRDSAYPNGDFHTMYIGEIVAVYEE